MSRLTALALYRMLFETCGEDPDVLNEAKITPIYVSDEWDSECVYHITYKEDDPFEGINFKVKMKILPRQTKPPYKVVCQYFVYDSVYGDDSDEAFEIEL